MTTYFESNSNFNRNKIKKWNDTLYSHADEISNTTNLIKKFKISYHLVWTSFSHSQANRKLGDSHTSLNKRSALPSERFAHSVLTERNILLLCAPSLFTKEKHLFILVKKASVPENKAFIWVSLIFMVFASWCQKC